MAFLKILPLLPHYLFLVCNAPKLDPSCGFICNIFGVISVLVFDIVRTSEVSLVRKIFTFVVMHFVATVPSGRGRVLR